MDYRKTAQEILGYVGGVMYIAVICVIMYLVVDLLYTVVDPRIRLGKESS